MKRGIFIAPFGELCEPRLVAELAQLTEQAGFDGFFVWDHVAYYEPVTHLADPWVCLSAAAMVTSRVILGPLVTPLPRRRMHQLARETVTLDRLCGGRLVLGVGIGSEVTGEFVPERFGEEGSARERGRLLDEGLEQLGEYWAGGFEPRPVSGRIPVWAAAVWPAKKPLRRAARLDGVFPIQMPSPAELSEVIELVGGARPGYDIVVTNRPDVDPEPWAAAGATWCLTGFSHTPSEAEVRAAIDAGP